MPIVGCTDLRIGASAGALQYLRHRGIPEPDVWTYQGYTVIRTAGTGQQKGYGFPVASWSWPVLDQDQLNVLLDFFDAADDASVLIYISTYTDTGRGRTTSDYSAYMQRPVDGEGKAMFPRGGGNIWQDVTVTFTHLEAA